MTSFTKPEEVDFFLLCLSWCSRVDNKLTVINDVTRAMAMVQCETPSRDYLGQLMVFRLCNIVLTSN
jgi:hypothetical protein